MRSQDYTLDINGISVHFHQGFEVNASISLLGLDSLNFTLALEDVEGNQPSALPRNQPNFTR